MSRFKSNDESSVGYNVIDYDGILQHLTNKWPYSLKFTDAIHDMLQTNMLTSILILSEPLASKYNEPDNIRKIYALSFNITDIIIDIDNNVLDDIWSTECYENFDIQAIRNHKNFETFDIRHDGIVTWCTVTNRRGNSVDIKLDDSTMKLLDFIIRYDYFLKYRRFLNTVGFDTIYPVVKNCVDCICKGKPDTPVQNVIIKDAKLYNNCLKSFDSNGDNPIGDYDYIDGFLDTQDLLSQSFFNNQPDVSAIRLLSQIIKNAGLNMQARDDLSAFISHYVKYKLLPLQNNNAQTDSLSHKAMSPKDIYELIDKNVVHQNDAKKAAAMLMYNHINGHGRNMIMAGPTGCGKTEIWRTLSETFPFIEIINGPQLTAEGYKGGYKLSSIFMEHKDAPEAAEQLILVIDEADKVFEPQIISDGSDVSHLIQNELLKLMDHSPNSKMTFYTDRQSTDSALIVNCEHISVVLCGSFERLFRNKCSDSTGIGFLSNIDKPDTEACDEHDFVDYGNMRVELVGRINKIVSLNEMTASDFEYLLEHKTASPIKKLEKEFNIKLIINKKARQKMAEYAFETKLGCRAMNSVLTQCLDDVMFDSPTEDKYDLSKAIISNLNARLK